MGEHMPASESSAGEPSSSTVNSNSLLPHFMSIRLLLLRPASRRSAQDNEMIDILKNSFRAYSRDNRRSGAELANLLAKDWVCLKSTFACASLGTSLEPKLFRAIPRQPSTESNKRQAMEPLMSAKRSAPLPLCPMNPPSQFVSPPPRSMGMNRFMANTNSFLGSLNTHEFDTPVTYRRHSMDASAFQRNSTFEENAQRLLIEPQAIRSSTPNDTTQPIQLQPSVVLEN
jgi:hypothetical protein